jgi:ABC-type Fe3+-citrate transport system substrate-binding protein
MAETFLAETVRRLREMSKRMSKARRRTAELRDQIARDREEMHLGPLQAVRDLRLITEPATPRRRRR